MSSLGALGALRRSSTIFSSVIVKVYFTKQCLTQKIFKMCFYEGQKKYHVKYSFCRLYLCNKYYPWRLWSISNKFLDWYRFCTYKDYVSNFVSCTFTRTLTYINRFLNVPLRGPKSFYRQHQNFHIETITLSHSQIIKARTKR